MVSRRPIPTRNRARPIVSPQRFAELDRRARRRAAVRLVGVLIPIWMVLFGAYYLLPGTGFVGRHELLRLSASLALVLAVLIWQMRRVSQAAMPELQAIQALGVVIPVFLLVFSASYLSMSHASARTFSEPLDHTGALYLTITVFATVGFGDITPRTSAARLLVSGQMLLDLVILGAVVRAIFSAAKSGLARTVPEEAAPPHG